MEIKVNTIPHIYRNKYLRDGGGGSIGNIISSSSSSSGGGGGLPYTLDEDGNYVIAKKITVQGDIVGEGEVSAYGAGSSGGGETGGGYWGEIKGTITNQTDLVDYIANQIDNIDVITEVSWNDIQNKPATYIPSAHNHTISNITNLQTVLDAKWNKTDLIYTDTLTDRYGYTLKQTIIDASTLDENTWYPVTIILGSKNNVRIEVIVSLDSGTKPSWSTHTGGFSVRKIWETNGNGWGVNNINRIVYASDYSFTATDPVRNLGQMVNSSNEYVYVRGGGKYTFRTSHGTVPVLRTETYTVLQQSVSPVTTTPAAIVVNNALITSNVASATRLQTARTLTIGSTGKLFDGLENVSWSLTEIGAAATNHLHTFDSLTSKPTTIAGYGITDAPTKTGTGASGTWGINITGNAGTATKLTTARTINGTSFDGTTNITTANWGTSRTITIGSTGKTVNGSANVVWTLGEIGAASAGHTHTFASLTSKPTTLAGYGITDAAINTHTHNYLPLSGGTLTGALTGTTINMSGNITAAGEVTAYSDIRLKKNVKALENRGELNPVTYIKDGKESIGFIAQEIKELYPELVIDGEYLSLNYAQLTAVLASQINELRKEVEQLKAK